MSERSLGNVVVAIRAVDECSSVMDRIRASMGVLAGALGQLGGGFAAVGNVMSGFAAAGVAGAAIAGLSQIAQGLQTAITEATASQQAFADLAIMVEKSGTAWSSVEQKTRSYLLTLQETTTYTDEQAAGALDTLMTSGMSYAEAMKVLGTVVDFAAAKHLDLATAALVVGKAFGGNATLLQRYGIDVKDVIASLGKGATESEIFAAVLKKLNDQFGGTAQKQADTYAGTQERLKNAWLELSEKVGTILLPALTSITQAMIPIVDWLGRGVDALQLWFNAFAQSPEGQAFIKDVQTAFVEVSTAIQQAITDVVTFFGTIVSTPEFKAFVTDMGSLVKAFGDLAKVVIPATVTGFLDGLKDAGPAAHFLAQELGTLAFSLNQLGQVGGIPDLGTKLEPLKILAAGIRAVFDDLVTVPLGITGVIIAAFSSLIVGVSGALAQFLAICQGFASGLTLVGSMISNALNLGAISSNIQTLGATLTSTFASIMAGAGIVAASVGTAFGALQTVLIQVGAGFSSLASTVSSTVQAMGAAVISACYGITLAFISMVEACIAEASRLWAAMVGHSIWPDMLSQMENQTKDSLGAIAGMFQGGFAQIPTGVPSFGGGGATASGAGSAGGDMRLNIPISTTVSVDGQVIANVVEQRRITKRKLASPYR
jgi:hypothetical protein